MAEQELILPQVESLEAEQGLILPQVESLEAEQGLILPQVESLEAELELTLDIMPTIVGKSGESAYIALARIGRPRGVEGEFFVRPLADNLVRFEKLEHVCLVQQKRRWPTLVESARLISGRVAIKVEGISTPEDVRPWTNGYLEIEQAGRIELAEGNYFHDDLVGLRVISTQGEQLGILVKVLEMPANDVYVCRTPGESGGVREFLIPAVEDIVRKIDLSAGQIIIEPLPGLLD